MKDGAVEIERGAVSQTVDDVWMADSIKSHSFVLKSRAGLRIKKRSKIAAEAAAVLNATRASQELCTSLGY